MADDHPLPRISAPARRALASIGVERLDQLTDHRVEDLAKLHGVGTKALTRLRDALADRNLSFRD